ncbi:CLUMA_CG020366, isoform A [Clunio marinus]|uniref:CLUMA_CG020366, isoform A n=1 Tax=Clunio marinus TaxID=568069 RepID=A0A1J1J4R2_9DIPT|nr:CLUMA_CG020366, isoform A [Clunio marinus]
MNSIPLHKEIQRKKIIAWQMLEVAFLFNAYLFFYAQILCGDFFSNH